MDPNASLAALGDGWASRGGAALRVKVEFMEDFPRYWLGFSGVFVGFTARVTFRRRRQLLLGPGVL